MWDAFWNWVGETFGTHDGSKNGDYEGYVNDTWPDF